MTALKDYEQQVVRLLTPGVLSPQEIDSVIREGELVELVEHRSRLMAL
jgi:hypothetical protein